ncbi:MAG: M14 family zinc carboxypeptidase [Capsulimonadaceae bacterium]
MAFTRTLGTASLLMIALGAPATAEKNLVRPPGTTRYAEMTRELRGFAAFDAAEGFHRLTLTSIGNSVEGRPIWMVRLHDGAVPGGSGSKPGTGVLYLCRQHGHEPASTEAALAFIGDLAHAGPGSDLDTCLRRVTVYVVPMANPDGAERYLRHNAHDVDLNRDWLARTQPETRALWRVIEEIHPDLMTDQHELYPNDYRPDFTETAGPKSEVAPSVAAACESVQEAVHLTLEAEGYPNHSFAIDDHDAPRLAHRYACEVAGIPAILFETNRSDPSRTVAMRALAHEAFMRTVLREAAGEHDALIAEATAALRLAADRTRLGQNEQPATSIERDRIRSASPPAGASTGQ